MTPTAETRALYRTMSDRELLDMQWAFQQDRERAVRLETIAFCDSRLALIEDEMRNRLAQHQSEPWG
jgi:hypothetical protein